MTTRSDGLACPPAPLAPTRGIGRFFATVLTKLAEWQERAEQRALLAAMDERMRKDIGISYVDALRESGKPFWTP